MILTGETEVLREIHYTASVVSEWLRMAQWWNDTDRGNWSTGRKASYSVGGRRMNEYGALVEWYWQAKLKYWEKNFIQPQWWLNDWEWNIGGMILTGETEVLGEKLYTASVVVEWLRMEHWRNDTDRRNWSRGRKTIQRRLSLNDWEWSFDGMILTGETEVLGEKHYRASVTCRMNECGALVKWYWQEKAEDLWENPVPVPDSSPYLTFIDVGSIFGLLEFVLPSSPSLLRFLDVCCFFPLHFVCLFFFLSIPYLHCPDWFSCAQTEGAKDWGGFLYDTSTLWVGFPFTCLLVFILTTRTVIRLHGFELFGDFEEWMVKNLEGSVRDKP